MAVHENRGEILVMFTCYDNLFCLFFIELNKVVTTHFSVFVKSLVRSEAEVLRNGEIFFPPNFSAMNKAQCVTLVL